MRVRKSQKLDLQEVYPCPCRRRGRIKPIVLTEAFGCDRCQQIFVVQEEGYVIEQLASHYPYRRSWRWTGHQWIVSRPLSPHHYLLVLSITFFAIFIFLLWWTTVQPPADASTMLRFGVMLLILLFLLMVLVMALRR